MRATYDTLVAILERAREEARSWADAERAVDHGTARLGGTEVSLDFVSGTAKTTIDFLGYAYRREPSAISGGTRILYDETRPEVWRVPLLTEVKPSLVVRAPKAGYLVPPAYAAWVAEKLALHGFVSVRVASARTAVAVEVFRADAVKLAERPFEARQRAELRGQWVKATRDVAAGALYVPVAQRAARLLLQLMEPAAPDSFVAWGFFNAVFEQKEYIESYVVEELAERMLAEDPALRAEFERRLAEDPAFAADPRRRLDFFHQRSPYWDARKDEVPILRVDSF